MTYRAVVVGTDGSDTAEEAVRHAGALCGATGARLVVVSAYADDGTARPEVEEEQVPAELRWVLTERGQAEAIAERGREVARQAGATDVVVRAVPSGAPDALLSAATEFDAEAIVVGSVGLTSSARFVLGSVASTVAHHAPCDVLIVQTA